MKQPKAAGRGIEKSLQLNPFSFLKLVTFVAIVKMFNVVNIYTNDHLVSLYNA